LISRWKKAYESRIKPIFFIQYIGSAMIILLLANNYLFEFSLLQFKIVFWLLALISFSLAVEDMLSKKQKSIYIFKFSTTIVYLVFPIFFFGT
jgi:hypothetical protein